MVAAALLPTMEVAAQNGKKVVLDSLMYISGPRTWYVYDEDFHQESYEGTELRAGFITDLQPQRTAHHRTRRQTPALY